MVFIVASSSSVSATTGLSDIRYFIVPEATEEFFSYSYQYDNQVSFSGPRSFEQTPNQKIKNIEKTLISDREGFRFLFNPNWTAASGTTVNILLPNSNSTAFLIFGPAGDETFDMLVSTLKFFSQATSTSPV